MTKKILNNKEIHKTNENYKPDHTKNVHIVGEILFYYKQIEK